MGMYGSLVNTLQRRKYKRLDRVSGKKEDGKGKGKSRSVRLGRNGSKRRRFRLRLKRRISWLNPRNLLRRLRDAYVRLMLRMAQSRVVSYGGGAIGSYGFGFVAGDPFPSRSPKEYDGKVLAEIYRSVILQSNQQMFPSGAV
eukprot:TRINITY_DN1088_c0_g2_i1.p1 TRINITY_DN1088_c0_g2~~TRINITY_DN1088_c0_g2_i1.p1  ORF type:complete len:142 (-),score=7.94 TRINITY_DN1088_c0_g2_i1:292-717(-)